MNLRPTTPKAVAYASLSVAPPGEYHPETALSEPPRSTHVISEAMPIGILSVGKTGKARSVSRMGLLIGYNDSSETALQVRRFVTIELSRFALEGR